MCVVDGVGMFYGLSLDVAECLNATKKKFNDTVCGG